MDKKVYICTNENTNYSRSILLTEAQAKAINWFIDNMLEDADYSCCLPEDCADDIL